MADDVREWLVIRNMSLLCPIWIWGLAEWLLIGWELNACVAFRNVQLPQEHAVRAMDMIYPGYRWCTRVFFPSAKRMGSLIDANKVEVQVSKAATVRTDKYVRMQR